METNDLPLFNYPVAPSNETETSKDAAESIKDKINGMCLDVLRCVRNYEDGLTCDEVEQILGMKHQTASARLNDLSKCHPASKVFKASDLDWPNIKVVNELTYEDDGKIS